MEANVRSLVAKRGASNPSDEELQIEGGGGKIAKFLGDGFALLGQANISTEGTRGKGLQKTMRRSRPTTDRATAPVEKAESPKPAKKPA